MVNKKVDSQKTVKIEEFEKIQQDFLSLQTRFDELTNQLKRAVADYQNLEKRVEEGKSELAAWVSANLINKLLPTLDYLEKVLEGTTPEEQKSGWLKGVEMATSQLKNTLKEAGLNEIDKITDFNPDIHEAVDIREGEDNKVLEVVRKGYSLHGKILRPAQVIVGRKEN